MSHLQSLITKHCPEGVPTLELGEIGEFTRGRRFTKKDVVAQGEGVPSIHYGEIYTSYQYMCPYILLHRSGLQFSYQSRPIFSK